MLAKGLPLPVITGSNSRHTLTWSRQPNMFYSNTENLYPELCFVLISHWDAVLAKLGQQMNMFAWPNWVAGVKASAHTQVVFLLRRQTCRDVVSVLDRRDLVARGVFRPRPWLCPQTPLHRCVDNYRVRALRGTPPLFPLFMCTHF